METAPGWMNGPPPAAPDAPPPPYPPHVAGYNRPCKRNSTADSDKRAKLKRIAKRRARKGYR